MRTIIFLLLLFVSSSLFAQEIPVNQIAKVINGDSKTSQDSTTARKQSFNWKMSIIILDGVEISRKQYDSINTEDIRSTKSLNPEIALKEYGEKGKNGAIILTSNSLGIARPITDIESEERMWPQYEEMPEFPGGQKAMMNYIIDNLRYPLEAQVKLIQGKVRVAFVITGKGKVEQVKISRGVHPLLDAEAIRVVSQMPDWQPAKFKGKAVQIFYNIPVIFTLPPKQP